MSAWKQFERRIARRFGTVRTPLSGRASRHTASDTLHPRLFIDAKFQRGFLAPIQAFRRIRNLAHREGKLPLVIAKSARQKDRDSLVVCRLVDLPRIAKSLKI